MKKIALTFAALMAMATPALASMPCGPAKEVVSRLTTNYGETLQMRALTNGGNIIAMYAHPQTGTWTLIAFTRDGKACPLAYGRKYEPEAEGKLL